METWSFKLFNTSMALLTRVEVEGFTTIIIAIFAQGVGSRWTKTIHYEVDTANFVAVELLGLSTMKFIREAELFVRLTLQLSHLFCC